jgi:hypothetical protein
MQAWIQAGIKRMALVMLFLLVLVACSADAGPVSTQVAGARGAGATPTPAAPMEQNIIVPAGGRFTVVCDNHRPIIYGDNGGDQPATGIAGYCE